MTHFLRALALPIALVATLALTSCGSGSDTPSAGSTSTPSVNTTAMYPADIQFATTMIAWHRQAEEMAALGGRQAVDAKVRAMAPTVNKAQGPEIKRMSGWLVAVGIPVPGAAGSSPTGHGMAGHDMSGMGGEMPAMMSTQEMAALGKAKGSGFDRMWLQMMVRHHQGAMAIAGKELTGGRKTEARQVAQSIIDRQAGEIVKLKSILAAIPG